MSEVKIGQRLIDGRTPIGTCDRCGHHVPRRQLKREWTGLVVCVGNANGAHNCYEDKHPSFDFQAKVDHSLLNPARDVPRDDFATPPMTYDELVASLKNSQS